MADDFPVERGSSLIDDESIDCFRASLFQLDKVMTNYGNNVARFNEYVECFAEGLIVRGESVHNMTAALLVASSRFNKTPYRQDRIARSVSSSRRDVNHVRTLIVVTKAG